MNDATYIGLDVHQATILVVLDSAGQLVMEAILETKAETILQFIRGLRGSLHLLTKALSAAWQIRRNQGAPRWPVDSTARTSEFTRATQDRKSARRETASWAAFVISDSPTRSSLSSFSALTQSSTSLPCSLPRVRYSSYARRAISSLVGSLRCIMGTSSLDLVQRPIVQRTQLTASSQGNTRVARSAGRYNPTVLLPGAEDMLKSPTLFFEDLLHLADFLSDFPGELLAPAFGFQVGIVGQSSNFFSKILPLALSLVLCFMGIPSLR